MGPRGIVGMGTGWGTVGGNADTGVTNRVTVSGLMRLYARRWLFSDAGRSSLMRLWTVTA